MQKQQAIVIVTALLASTILSCDRPVHRPKHLIVLADVSASIVPDARGQMFAGIEEMVSHLSRGDRMTILPIMGDASGDVQGHVLRFEAPPKRETYDEDLRRFRSTVEKSLSGLQAESMRRPASYTDILGTLEVAADELQQEPKDAQAVLIVFSDFLEDDQQMKFQTDKALRDSHSAQLLARKLAAGKSIPPGTKVFCGALRSSEWVALDPARRAAVREFWIAYLTALGGKVSFSVDGPAVAVRMVRDMR